MKNISPIHGKILVFGGVYSNLQALQAIKSVAQDLNILPSHILCTGDIIAYCARPVECIELMRDWGVHSISGNVEQQIAEGLDDCACDFTEGGRCDIFSKQWYPYAQSKIKGANLDWIKTLPAFLSFDYYDKRVVVLHGSYHDTSEFIFASTDWKTKQSNFDALNVDIILSGHCGLPFSQSLNDKYWLNAGVIGMPANDGGSHVWYMTIEMIDGQLKYEHHKLQYDYETAASLMDTAGLVPTYAQTLRSGIWDNMEILPEVEKNMQGKKIFPAD